MATATGPSHIYVGAARWTSGTKSGVFRKEAGGARWDLSSKGLPDDVHVSDGFAGFFAEKGR